MRKILLAFITVILLALTLAGIAQASESPVTLKFNGKNLSTDIAPVIKSGRTLVPVRIVSEALGADVKWNQETQQVTITKDDSVIVLTVNLKEVYKNGEKLTELDVPAQVIGGRTLVPVRFVSETLGADVTWDQPSNTVSVNFSERREGMTPEELLQKSDQAMQKQNSYKYKGSTRVEIRIAGIPQNIVSNSISEGQLKRNGSKTEVYQRDAVTLPDPASGNEESWTEETYIDDLYIYRNIDGGGWNKVTLNDSLSKLLEKQNPQISMRFINSFGLLTHGNEAEINGRKYYTLIARIDSVEYKNYLKNAIIADGKEDNSTLTTAEFNEQVTKRVNDMKIDFTEKVYIDKNSYLMAKIYVNGTISITEDGERLDEKLTGETDMYDFGAAATIPTIQVPQVTPPAIPPVTSLPSVKQPIAPPVKQPVNPPVTPAKPETGYLPGSDIGSNSGGCWLTVDNSTNDYDILVNVMRYGTVVREFYVLGGDAFTAKNLDTGIYEVKYKILSTGEAYKFDRTIELGEERYPWGVFYSHVTLILTLSQNGNIGQVPTQW